ncbi:MAG: hypothetical protein WDO56_23400 [Gammaproteobacteria bacterium]
MKTSLNVHELCEHVYHLLRAEAKGAVTVDRDYDPEPAERDDGPESDRPGPAQRGAQRAASAE